MVDKLVIEDELAGLAPAVAPANVLLMLLGVSAGVLAAGVILPRWLPGLVASLLGPSPMAYWYLSRASAMVAFGLLWVSMVLGLILTNRMARIWPGGPTAFDLHQHASLLGLAFALFHGLILTGDRYVNYTLAQLVVPFASTGYRPLWVGLGQVAFYLLALVGLSFYAARSLGTRLWRLIHYLSFAVFMLALAHGLGSGTDSGAAWVQSLYWISGGSILFLTIYRVLVRRFTGQGRPAEEARRPNKRVGPRAGEARGY